MAISRKYFQKLPSISYNDYVVRDVSIRSKLTQYIAESGLALLPYTVKDGERADQIANFYYGDSYYSWAIYLTNGIIDPYQEWPKTQKAITDYLEAKYGTVDKARDDIIRYEVNWAEDTSIITPEMYDALPSENKKYWEADFGFNNTIISYHRRELDWILDNNRLDSLQVIAASLDSNDVSFTVGERVYQYTSYDRVAVTSEVFGVQNNVSKNIISLGSSDVSFANGATTLTLKGTANILPTALVVGTNLASNTRVVSIVNATAVTISKATTGAASGSYTVTNPASAKLIVGKVNFYDTIFPSNTTLAATKSFFTYTASGDYVDYADKGNYLVGRTSNTHVKALSQVRLDTDEASADLLSNSHLSDAELVYWKPVDAYEEAFNLNERRKEIMILDKSLIEQLNDSLESLVTNG